MLPARFEYHRPESLEEALSLLNEHDDAKVLSGGMSLIPLMKLRFAAPGHLVDINRIEGLSGVSESGGWLRIGALSRHNELAGSDMLKARYPVMAAAAPQIADPIVRNLGTIGGSLAHADPAGDWGSVMLAMDAQVVATGSAGDRTIAIGDLFESTFTTTLAPNEILTQVQVPQPSGRSGGAYLKVERKVGDFATVGVAVHLELDDGHIANTGIGLTAVGSANISRPRRRRLRSGVQSPPRSCSRKRGDWQLRRPILRPTSGGAPSTSGTWSRCSFGAGWPAPFRWPEGSEPAMQVKVTVNGVERTADVEPRLLLVHLLREVFGLTGTHIGCDTTSCGACTVLLDGTPVKSCTVLGVQADGRSVTTVEGLMQGGALHPIQAAFKEEHGLQCGFCTPGMMLVGSALLEDNPSPTDDEVRWAISGNICRCTGYMNIVKAIQAAGSAMAEQQAAESVPAAAS